MNQKNKAKYLELYKKYGEIKIKCQGASELPIDAITDFQGKLKKITDKNKINLATQIFSKGFIAPFFVWNDQEVYKVLDGHQRSIVICEIRETGIPVPAFFPVVYIEADNEEDAREKLLGISSQYGEFDESELNDWIKNIDDEIKDSLRITNKELDISTESETEADDELPEEVEPITKLGDLWELGKHRLLCGDSTDEKQVDRLMDGKKADMVFTDPPYGVSIGDKNKLLDSIQKAERIKKNIKNDTLNVNDLENILIECFKNIKNISNDCCSYYVTAPQGGELGMMMMMMMKSGLPVKHIIIWNKNKQCFSMGRLDYEYKHEPILYTWNKKHIFYGKGRYKNSVWDIDKENKCNIHPTMKPIELIENAILNSSLKNMIIVDTFLGSGSTLIACEKTNRICYGMELDEHYCDVIVQRYIDWCNKNNKKPVVKLNGKLWQ